MIDYARLRKDLLDYAEVSYFRGDEEASMVYIGAIKNATNEELLNYARQIGFREEDYIKNDYKRER